MATNSPSKPKRPPAVTIAGWILLLGALLNILVGVLFLYASNILTQDPNAVIIFEDEESPDLLTDSGEELAQGIGDLLLGIVQLAITIGFWRQQRWAWVAAMSWQALKLLFEIASVFVGGGTGITILFASLLVFLLNQSDVRRAFNIRRPENEPSLPPIRTLDVN